MHADLPLTAAIRQSQQTLYHGHTTDRQGKVRVSYLLRLSGSMLLGFCFYHLHILTGGFLEVSHINCGNVSMCVDICVFVAPPAVVRISPCHSRQPSVISDASAADGDRSSTPSDINSPRHRTHSLCNVRAAWPPQPSNHTSTPFIFFCWCLSLCPVSLLGVSLRA